MMFALDRLMVVMPLEHVTVLDESVFNATIKHGEILKLIYSQKVPALLNIKIDYENSEAVIESTGNILGERYKELIRLTNIKQCIDNINALRIVKINRDSKPSVWECSEVIFRDAEKCRQADISHPKTSLQSKVETIRSRWSQIGKFIEEWNSWKRWDYRFYIP